MKKESTNKADFRRARATAFWLGLALACLVSVWNMGNTLGQNSTLSDVKVKIAYFTLLLQIDPDNAEAHFRRSQYYRLVHDYWQELNDLKAAVVLFQAQRKDQLYADQAEVLCRLLQFCFQDEGAAYRELHLNRQALSAFSNAILENPTAPQLYSLRADVLDKTGDHALAATDRNKASHLIDRSAAEEEFYQNLAKALRHYQEEQDFEEAIGWCNEALKFRPKSVQGLSLRQKLLILAGKFSLAVCDLKHLSQLQPHNAKWGSEQLRIKLLLRRFPGSEKDSKVEMRQLAEAKKISTSADVMPPISVINAYIQHHPADTRGYSARADYYVSQKNLVAAISDLSKIMDINPLSFLALTRRAHCYAALPEKAKALADYQMALANIDSIARGSLMKLEGTEEILFSRAGALASFGDHKEAIEDYNKLLILDPDSEEAYRYRGDSYKKLGNFEKALEDYSDSIKRDKDSAGSTYRARADVYAHLGKSDLARRDLEKAQQLGY